MDADNAAIKYSEVTLDTEASTVKRPPNSVTRIKIVTDGSLMAQTLNGFERGEQNTKNLTSVSGKEYYYRTIHD